MHRDLFSLGEPLAERLAAAGWRVRASRVNEDGEREYLIVGAVRRDPAGRPCQVELWKERAGILAVLGDADEREEPR